MTNKTQKIYKVDSSKNNMKREKNGVFNCGISIPLNLNRCNA